MRKLADTVGNNDENNMSNPAVAADRPDFQAFASLPKGALHTAANVQPGMRIPPEDLQRLASTHPDANIRARAQLVLDIARWRANKAAAAGGQTLEKAAMTGGNKYVEKVAEQEDLTTSEKVRRGIAAAGVGVIGLDPTVHAYRKALKEGHLTGRETLFHGTHDANAPSILQEGILPKESEGLTATTEKLQGQGNLGSGKHVFTSPEDWYAANYRHTYHAAEHEADKASFYHKVLHQDSEAFDKIRKVRAAAPADIEGLIRVNVPSWKKEFQKIEDPELAAALTKNPHLPEHEVNRMKDFYKSHHAVFPGGVPPEYLPDSPRYKTNSAAEILSYVKRNPRRFLTEGVGPAAVPAVLSGAAAAGVYYGAGKYFKNMKGA